MHLWASCGGADRGEPASWAAWQRGGPAGRALLGSVLRCGGWAGGTGQRSGWAGRALREGGTVRQLDRPGARGAQRLPHSGHGAAMRLKTGSTLRHAVVVPRGAEQPAQHDHRGASFTQRGGQATRRGGHPTLLKETALTVSVQPHCSTHPTHLQRVVQHTHVLGLLDADGVAAGLRTGVRGEGGPRGPRARGG